MVQSLVQAVRMVDSGRSGSDHQPHCPLLNLDASRYQAIEIGIANGMQAHGAQLFYAGTNARFNEAHALC